MKRTTLGTGKKRPGTANRKGVPAKKTTNGRLDEGRPGGTLRVLLLEDNPADAELIERGLRRSGFAIHSRRVDSREEFLTALAEFRPQVILSDFSLPRFDGLSALQLARVKLPFVPFIVVTGSIGEEQAVACLRAGADDYLLKDRLARLGEAVRQALEKHTLQEEKQKAEARLRQSEERFRVLTERSPFGIVLMDRTGSWMYANPRFSEMTGYTLAEVPDGRSWFAKVFPNNEERLEAVGQWQQDFPLIRAGESVKRQFRVRARDGRDRFLDITSTSLGRDQAILVFEDVSEKREAGEALKASEARYRLISENSGDVIWVLNLATMRFTYVSPSVLRLRGYTAEEVLAQPLAATMTPETHRAVMEVLPGRLARFAAGNEAERIWTNEADQLHRDGRVIPIEMVTTLLSDEAGQVTDILGVSRNISERKRADEALRESEVRFSSVFHSSPMPIALSRLRDNRLVDLNAAWEAMTGYSRQEAIGRSPTELGLWVDPGLRERMIASLTDRQRLQPLELQVRRKDGAVVDALLSADLVELAGENHLVTIAVDISKRKQAEELLHERDLLLKNLSAQIPGMIYTFLRRPDGSYRIPFSSDAMQEVFGVSPQEASQDAASVFRYMLPEDRPKVVESIEESARTMNAWHHEYRVQLPGQPVRWMWGRSEPHRLADGGVLWYGFIADITGRKETEAKIERSLREKEVLLKEIHHRVKNNLTIVSGLLALQMEKIGDEALRATIRQSQNRIWTMALIHQMLYQTGDLADIDMADYIATLVGSLLSTHAQTGTPANVDFDLEPLRLAIDEAIPLALIVNELVTNALKHAFPGGRPGAIRVSLRRLPAPEAGRCELAVVDNGAGLPGDFDMEAQKSLGLKLVAMLTEQLGGTLAVERAGGAAFRITFPEREKP